jgi:hypothetical protein
MKVELLCLDSAIKPSPISEGVADIRIDSQPCNGINLTHDTCEQWMHHEWPQFTTWSKSQDRSYLALVPSSTRMPQGTICGWPDTILYNIHKEVGYHPTRWHTKLLSLRDPIIPYVPVHNQVLVHSDPTTTGLNWHKRGLPSWSSEFTI